LNDWEHVQEEYDEEYNEYDFDEQRDSNDPDDPWYDYSALKSAIKVNDFGTIKKILSLRPPDEYLTAGLNKALYSNNSIVVHLILKHMGPGRYVERIHSLHKIIDKKDTN
jgi:hypothetical protein